MDSKEVMVPLIVDADFNCDGLAPIGSNIVWVTQTHAEFIAESNWRWQDEDDDGNAFTYHAVSLDGFIQDSQPYKPSVNVNGGIDNFNPITAVSDMMEGYAHEDANRQYHLERKFKDEDGDMVVHVVEDLYIEPVVFLSDKLMDDGKTYFAVIGLCTAFNITVKPMSESLEVA